MGEVCACTEKTRIKSLETVGVVRDNALTGGVDFASFRLRDLPGVGQPLLGPTAGVSDLSKVSW